MMLEQGFDPARFGWASVQLDGGIQKVMRKMMDWFRSQKAEDANPEMTGLVMLRMGLMAQGYVSEPLSRQLAALTRMIVAAGGTVVVHSGYRQDLEVQPRPTLGYAQTIKAPGFHVMKMPSRSWGEMLTGLGASGLDLIVAHIGQQPLSGHPLIPTLQVTSLPKIAATFGADLDGFFEANHAGLLQLISLIVATLERTYVPQTLACGNTDFLITRGLLGVSL
jgi:hypothetical protein